MVEKVGKKGQVEKWIQRRWATVVVLRGQSMQSGVRVHSLGTVYWAIQWFIYSCLIHTTPHTPTHALREWHIWCHPICMTHATHTQFVAQNSKWNHISEIKDDQRQSLMKKLTDQASFYMESNGGVQVINIQQTVECIISLIQRQMQIILKEYKPTVPYQWLMNESLTSSSPHRFLDFFTFGVRTISFYLSWHPIPVI